MWVIHRAHRQAGNLEASSCGPLWRGLCIKVKPPRVPRPWIIVWIGGRGQWMSCPEFGHRGLHCMWAQRGLLSSHHWALSLWGTQKPLFCKKFETLCKRENRIMSTPPPPPHLHPRIPITQPPATFIHLWLHAFPHSPYWSILKQI